MRVSYSQVIRFSIKAVLLRLPEGKGKSGRVGKLGVCSPVGCSVLPSSWHTLVVLQTIKPLKYLDSIQVNAIFSLIIPAAKIILLWAF